jgi:hypothetical protein
MHAARQTRTTAAPRAPLAPAVTFVCTCCETAEIAPTSDLPESWATESIFDAVLGRHRVLAYCGDCAIDLPLAADQGTAQ